MCAFRSAPALRWHRGVPRGPRRVPLEGPSAARLARAVGGELAQGLPRRQRLRAALRDVCAQMKRESVLCVWDAGTSWGLQIADYALWAIQRRADGGASTFFPWGATTPMSWS